MKRIASGVLVTGALVLAPLGASAVASDRSLPRSTATSPTYAGWRFAVKGVKSVTTKFTVPSFSCTSTFSGVEPGAFVLTGSSKAPLFSGAGLSLICQKGTAMAKPTTVIDDKQAMGRQHVYAGDVVETIVETSASAMTATVEDLTTGHTFKFSRTGSGGTSFEQLVIDDALDSQGTTLPVPDFGTIRFRAATINGKALGVESPRERVSRETSAKVVQIATGALSSTAEDAFSTVWKHA
jgi:hypothetical protein